MFARRRFRRWYQDLLNEALIAPEDVDLRHVTGITYEQVEHDYLGRRPVYEGEFWLGKRTLTTGSGARILWEVDQSVNYWPDPLEAPALLFRTYEILTSEEEARTRYELRRRVFTTMSAPLD